jgi:predicted permease
MAAGGIVEGIRIDVVRLHETWMELVFPRQRTAVHRVLGKWKPRTRADEVKYYAWGAVGVPLVAVLYPLLVVGFAVRFNARRFDTAATRLGLVGVLVVTALVWGLLTALARVRLQPDGFVAVAAASTVAVVSAGLAVVFRRVGGRATTVLLAYPFAMNAIFLPPVVAALYDPALGVIIERSTDLANFFRDDVFVGPLDPVSDYLSENYDFEGVVVALMWFCIATPLGWLLGLLVTLADLVRPKSVEEQVEAEQA